MNRISSQGRGGRAAWTTLATCLAFAGCQDPGAPDPEPVTLDGAHDVVATVSRDAAGRINTVLLPPRPSRSDEVSDDAIAAAARRVLDERRELLGLPDHLDTGALVLAPPERVTDLVLKVSGHETWRGLRVLGTEFSLLFSPDGQLLGYVGLIRAADDYGEGNGFDVDRALAALQATGAVQVTAGAPRLSRTAATRWTVELAGGQRLDAERVVSPEHGVVAWQVTGPDHTWLVDEVSGDLIGDRAHVEHAGSSIVSRRVLRGDARNNTADWRAGIGALATTELVNSPVMKTYLDPNNQLCNYSLQSGLGNGTSNQLFPRVVDGTGDFVTGPSTACDATSYNAMPCPFSFQCAANVGDGSYYRQQTYHSYLTQALDVLRSRVHPWVPPNSGWDVSLAIDEPLNGVCGNDSGCFRWNPWFRSITMTSYNAGVNVLWHELGHYFDWTYGWLGGGCNDADESLAVQETLADVVASLLAKREFDPRYQDRYTRSQFDFGFHSNNANRVNHVAGTQGCIANGEYGMGEAFYQAMWEISFGLNCDQVACTGSETGVSTRTNLGDIGWGNRQVASEALLRGLAFSLQVVGSAVTFRQLSSLIYQYLGMQYGGFQFNSIAADARAIFQHHGLM